MIKDTTIYFGYGDIIVHNGWYTLKFIHINNQYPIGFDTTEISATDTEISHITIDFRTMTSLNDFISKLKDVLLDGMRSFEYNGYTFDFTNYNEDSVEVCIRQAETLVRWLLVPLAA